MMHYQNCQTLEIHESLCGCCSDMQTCCYTMFCPQCAEANAWAESRGDKCSICHCIHWPSSFWTRQNIRRARGMEPSYCCDILAAFCCSCCFTNQNIRELKLIKEASQMTSNSSENADVNVYVYQAPV